MQNPIAGLNWSVDGKTLVVSAQEGVYFFDANTGSLIRNLGKGGKPLPLVMDKQGKLLLVGNRVWDVLSGQLLYQIPMENISSAAFSPSSETLAIGTDEGSLTLWDALTGKPGLSINNPQTSQSIGPMIYTTEESLLYVVDGRKVNQVDLASTQSTELFTLPENSCCSVFSQDANYMVISLSDHGIGSKQLWDLRQGKMLLDTGNCDSDVTFSAIRPNNQHFVVGCSDNAQLWDIPNQTLNHKFPYETLLSEEPVSSLPLSPEWHSAAFSPDNTQIALGNLFGEVLIWDLRNFQYLKSMRIPQPQKQPESGDGQNLPESAPHIFAHQTNNGYTASIVYYYVDTVNLIFQIQITQENRTLVFSEQNYAYTLPNLYDKSDRLINAAVGGGPAFDPGLLQFEFITPLPDETIIEGAFSFDLQDYKQPDKTLASFRFDFSLPNLNRVWPSQRFYPKQTSSANGLELLLDSVVISPTQTQVYLCFPSPFLASWDMGHASILQLDGQTATPVYTSLLFDSALGGDKRAGREPDWIPPVETGHCTKTIFPVGSTTPTAFSLEIPQLEYIMRAPAPGETPKEIPFSMQAYPGLTPKQAFYQYLQEAGNFYSGPWKFQFQPSQ